MFENSISFPFYAKKFVIFFYKNHRMRQTYKIISIYINRQTITSKKTKAEAARMIYHAFSDISCNLDSFYL